MEFFTSALYGNVDPRRWQERKDAKMVSEDHKAMANLSPVVINKQFDAWEYPERLSMFDQSQRKIR